MAEEGRSYEGGLADAAPGGGEDGGAYQNFAAYEAAPVPGITLVNVSGEVRVGNPGVKPVLSRAVPQGANPNILLLRLDLIQQPGFWPEVVVMKSVTYVGLAKGGPYTAAQITNPQIGDHTVPFTR
jgi:hypothetical protein